MTSIPLDVGGFRGLALIDGHAADVDLAAFREIDEDGIADCQELIWSGKAAILDPPSFNLLEFIGTIEVAIGPRTAGARVVDATPGSGFIYIDGVGRPPFDTNLFGDLLTGRAVRLRAPYGVTALTSWHDDALTGPAELTA